MFAEILGRVRHPQALSPAKLLRATVSVLAMSARGLLFRRPHRLLPPAVHIGSADFCIASLLFFAAAALRHSALGGGSLMGLAIGCALSYGILFLVSFGEWMAEFTLYLCISIGIDVLVSCLLLTGLIGAGSGTAQSWFFIWQLAATFVALFQLRLARAPTSPPNPGE